MADGKMILYCRISEPYVVLYLNDNKFRVNRCCSYCSTELVMYSVYSKISETSVLCPQGKFLSRIHNILTVNHLDQHEGKFTA